MQMADDEGAFTIDEFCRRYSVGRTKAYEYIGLGKLTAKKSGSRTLIPIASARQWFKSLPQLETQEQANAA